MAFCFLMDSGMHGSLGLMKEHGGAYSLVPIPVSGYDESCLAETKCPVMQPLSNTGTT